MRRFAPLVIALALFGAVLAQLPGGFPQSASFGLFPIEGSGVGGSLQLTEEPGHTRAAVTLTGIARGSYYLPVLFEGTCGPDREFVAALPPVGSFTNDPFASIGELDVPLVQIMQNEYFLYIFEGSEMPAANEEGFLEIDRAVACGQVGLGANR